MSDQFHHRRVELGRFIHKRLVSGLLEPDEFLRGRNQCVEIAHAGFCRDLVIAASEKEEHGNLQRGHNFMRFSADTSAHIASREKVQPRWMLARSKVDDSGPPRTIRPNFHMDMDTPPGWPSTRSSHVRCTHNFLAVWGGTGLPPRFRAGLLGVILRSTQAEPG
jgi:hypothetical protein